MAKLRGKEDYQLGDLSIVIDNMVKEEVCTPTGEEDDFPHPHLNPNHSPHPNPDHSPHPDQVCKLTGKDDYVAGDLSTEIDARVKAAAAKHARTGGDAPPYCEGRARRAGPPRGWERPPPAHTARRHRELSDAKPAASPIRS